jgi:hypothetical protein
MATVRTAGEHLVVHPEEIEIGDRMAPDGANRLHDDIV